jgi:hypothetical protein
VTGPWKIEFAPELGASCAQGFDKLISWSAHSDRGVKYFSGSANYAKMLQIPRAMLGRHKRLYLDLGRVEVTAEVRLNGKNLGLLWKKPFRLDISEAAKPGDNQLEVRVTNLSSPAGRFTFTSWRLWKASDPLLDSGLLGPVTLVAAEEN